METVIYVFNRGSIRASAFTLWPFQKKFNRPMSTIWQNLKTNGFSGAKISLSDVYKRRNKRSKYSEGQKVKLRRCPAMRFEVPAKMFEVKIMERGWWISIASIRSTIRSTSIHIFLIIVSPHNKELLWCVASMGECQVACWMWVWACWTKCSSLFFVFVS